MTTEVEMEIRAQSHPYRVVEVNGAREALEAAIAGGAPFFLIDRRVATLHAPALQPALDSGRALLIDATEEAKSYEQLVPLFCSLLEQKCRRNSGLVVIGGGVLQDIGCFIASVLLRGLRWTLLPTTLLAQCDSCIGSKSSLNINRYKNQLGTFYPPHQVQLALEFLTTLTQEEMLSGLGEAIKLHMVDGDESLAWLRPRLARALTDTASLREIVWGSLRIKQRFIETDEFDRGVRNVLNYGHTFAHAFESATGYAIPHGIAVTLGIAGAVYFSERLGLVSPGAGAELGEWLRPFAGGFESTLRSAEPATIVAAMKQDKKNDGGKITFILTRGPGRMEKMPLDEHTAAELLEGFLRYGPFSPRTP